MLGFAVRITGVLRIPFFAGFYGVPGLLDIDHDIDAVVDGVEKLDEGRRGDGDADAVGFSAFLSVRGDDLDVIPDIRGECIGVQNVQPGFMFFQNNVHGLPFLPVLRLSYAGGAFA